MEPMVLTGHLHLTGFSIRHTTWISKLKKIIGPAIIEDFRACGRTVRPVTGDVSIENEVISYPSYLDGVWWEGHNATHKLLLKLDMSYIEVWPNDVSQKILEGKYSIEDNNIILHRPNIPDLKGVILPNDSGEIYIDFDKYGWMIEGSDEDKAELESELKTKIQQHKPYFVCL